jgi:hypothetical protein
VSEASTGFQFINLDFNTHSRRFSAAAMARR